MKMNRIGFGLGLLATSRRPPAPWPSRRASRADLPVIGVPVPGGVNYQPAVTPVAHDMHWLSRWVHGIMLVIVLFVVALLAIVIVRYNSRSQPEPGALHPQHQDRDRLDAGAGGDPDPDRLVLAAGPVQAARGADADLTIKATGNQWYWTYDYPDNEFSFDSLMLPREELAGHGYTAGPLPARHRHRGGGAGRRGGAACR